MKLCVKTWDSNGCMSTGVRQFSSPEEAAGHIASRYTEANAFGVGDIQYRAMHQAGPVFTEQEAYFVAGSHVDDLRVFELVSGAKGIVVHVDAVSRCPEE